MCNMNNATNNTPKVRFRRDRTLSWKHWIEVEDRVLGWDAIGYVIRPVDSKLWKVYEVGNDNMLTLASTKKAGASMLLGQRGL